MEEQQPMDVSGAKEPSGAAAEEASAPGGQLGTDTIAENAPKFVKSGKQPGKGKKRGQPKTGTGKKGVGKKTAQGKAQKVTPKKAGAAVGKKKFSASAKEGDKVLAGGRPGGALTMDEIVKDRLTKLAEENWSPAARAQPEPPAFKPKLVEEIYKSELGGAGDTPPAARRVQLLEISQYLENYLWPHFDAAAATPAHVMSIILMLNEKFKEQVSAWGCFQERQEEFPAFLNRVLTLKAEYTAMRMHERVAYLVFVIHTFQSLENELVRSQVLRLVSLPLWHALSRGRLQLELHDQPQLAKHWKHLAKKEAKAAKEEGHVPIQQRPEAAFVPGLVQELLDALQAVTAKQGGKLDRQQLLYCERSVEFLTDMLGQLPTRRFLHAVLEDKAVLVKCYMAPLYRHPQGRLFVQLVDLLRFYMSFPIHDHTGDPLGEEDLVASHYEKVQQLQRLFFAHVPKLRELALANCGTVEKREVLRKELTALAPEELKTLVTKQLRLVSEDDPWAQDPSFLAEVMLATYERRKPQAEVVNAMPLYPTETLLFDENQVPSVQYTGDGVLALPKLNLQFLTFHDYLLRNFNLFRLEATYEIREDVLDVLKRVGAYLGDNDQVGFSGWARMAHPLDTFAITEVRKPKVGENKPAAVTAEVTINTAGMRGDIKAEWDGLKQHDVLFLLTLQPPDAATALEAAQQQGGQDLRAAIQQYGLRYVRGAEVIEIRDEDGKLMNDFTGRVRPDEWTPPQGTVRTVTLAMDAAQYQMDLNYVAKHPGSEDVYATFNLLMRRKPKENNFKAVLESIRDLMNEDCVVPPWLHDILLGYGDPGAAQYKHMEGVLQTVDFKDTFLDADHVREAFPGYEVEFVNNSKSEKLQRPFRITFPPFKQEEEQQKKGRLAKGKRKAGEAAVENGGPAPHPQEQPRKLVVESYTPPDPGPYPQDAPPQNTVRFTPVQTGAILSGVQPGLTMVVGPPGTGKTDTAVQIMHILYHNCPSQRTLVVTHSNQALNDLFTKIVERDVPARYLLRLGMGEQDLETEMDFSRVGRVNAMLARRLELLAEVERMAKLFGVAESVAYTCETAAYFWLLHVLSRWEKFRAQCSARGEDADCVGELFPFKDYFADAPQPLFKGRSFEEDMEKANGCFRHLKTMFQELEEIRPFELLKTQADRVNYLSTKQAKIVAMTCTHAALKRREFLELGFKYDNLLMEESGQILEIETFIPMLLQNQEHGRNRLKRVILIGDHHQLPPVVKNMAIQKYSQLDQSLFTRFIRLGTPYIELNAQGRSRPSLSKLFNWRYRQLGDLQAVASSQAFQLANPGLALDFQFIDVQDFNGRGESEPVPYFYQNLGEAEYLVSLYQYMRLLGYPASKISILTTYNGQKALIRDVIERRCANHPAFGRPAKVTTVDKYQGQQNDYVLLSLVRTRAFGHLRDVRRLVVAMSRARLGLYVFGRAELFGNCYELQPTFSQLLARPTQLCLLPGERYGSMTRLITELPPPSLVVLGPEHMAIVVSQIGAGWEAEQLMQQHKQQELDELNKDEEDEAEASDNSEADEQVEKGGASENTSTDEDAEEQSDAEMQE